MVPEALWNDGRPDRSHFLETGKIFLYRAGSYVPEMVAEVNRPQVITPGRWLWIAEADDYVSVVSGKINYPEGAERFDRGLIGPVVPACTVDLGEAEAWQGIERLDAVSLDRAAVYPVVVKDRRRFLVPEGRFLAYAVGADGVTAISRVKRCAAGETVALARPEPPAGDRQDLMVSVQLPESLAGGGEDLAAVLEPAGRSSSVFPQPPTAALRTRSRATFFFLDADAREPLVLEIRHPGAEPHRQELAPLAGSVRELPDVELEPAG